MSYLRIFLVVFLLAPIAQDESPGFLMWTASELTRLNATLSGEVAEDQSARVTLADYGNPSGAHRFRFIRRDADGIPEQHQYIEDVAFIQSGEGILHLGGELGGRTGTGGEFRGTHIVGGIRYPVAAGDILHIPADVPHRYLVPQGGHVTYVLVRMPAFTGETVVRADAPALTLEPLGFAMWRSSELFRRDIALSSRMGLDHSARETLADYGNPSGAHRFRYIRRDADGVPEIHDDIIDVVFITSGAGRLLVGGRMLNRSGSRGTGIAGGETHAVGVGDVLHIPSRTPHGYLVPPGGHITYVLVRVPAFAR